MIKIKNILKEDMEYEKLSKLIDSQLIDSTKYMLRAISGASTFTFKKMYVNKNRKPLSTYPAVDAIFEVFRKRKGYEPSRRNVLFTTSKYEYAEELFYYTLDPKKGDIYYVMIPKNSKIWYAPVDTYTYLSTHNTDSISVSHINFLLHDDSNRKFLKKYLPTFYKFITLINNDKYMYGDVYKSDFDGFPLDAVVEKNIDTIYKEIQEIDNIDMSKYGRIKDTVNRFMKIEKEVDEYYKNLKVVNPSQIENNTFEIDTSHNSDEFQILCDYYYIVDIAWWNKHKLNN